MPREPDEAQPKDAAPLNDMTTPETRMAIGITFAAMTLPLCRDLAMSLAPAMTHGLQNTFEGPSIAPKGLEPPTPKGGGSH